MIRLKYTLIVVIVLAILQIIKPAQHHKRPAHKHHHHVGRPDPNITCETSAVYPDKSAKGGHICFYSNQAGCVSSENDLFNNADYAERLLGVVAKIIFPAYIQEAQFSVRCALPKFQKRFPNRVYFCGEPFKPSHFQEPPSPLCSNLSYVAKYVAECDMIYSLKYGGKAWEPVYPDSFMEDIPTAFHSVAEWEMHGTTYAALTDEAAFHLPNRPVVPHLVREPDPLMLTHLKGYRDQFGIPDTALVLCNHGGEEMFNTFYAEQTLLDLLSRHGTDKLHFLFMGMPKLMESFRAKTAADALLTAKVAMQVHFMNGTADEELKERYFITCSALLHAAKLGEVFGTEIAEFSVRNKAVLISDQGMGGRYFKSAHIDIMGSAAYYHRDQKSLVDLVETLMVNGTDNRTAVNAYSEFSPQKVMQKFKNVFLNPIYGTDYFYYPNKTVNGSHICFFSNQASERGTEAAMFDYADFAESLLGVTSSIIFPANIHDGPLHNRQSLPRFHARFDGRVFYCGDLYPARNSIVCPNLAYVAKHVAKCDLLYALKYGPKTWEPVYPDSFNESIPLAFHAVFEWQKHGTTYAAVSPEIMCGNGSIAVVPHIIRRPDPVIVKHAKNFREDFNISSSAFTMCRHGGDQTFDLPYVEAAIVDILERHNEEKLHFVFLGTPSLQRRMHIYVDEDNTTTPAYKMAMAQKIDTQMHFLRATTVEIEKERFFQTCDAMLHAGRLGETFGLAVAEFSIRNKPVITQAFVGDPSYRSMHVEILKDKAYYYRDRASLVALVGDLLTYGTGNITDYDAYAVYSAENVMQQFKEVFLDPVFGGG